MSLPTASISVTAVRADGTPIAGAAVVARLSAVDTYDGVIVPSKVTVAADANGHCTLALFPNGLGTQSTHYTVRIEQGVGELPRQVRIYVPTASALDIEDLLLSDDAAPYPITGPVLSMNGRTGAITLGVNDIANALGMIGVAAVMGLTSAGLPDMAQVSTRGRAAAADGAPFAGWYSSTSLATPDNVMVFLPADKNISLPGRFLRTGWSPNGPLGPVRAAWAGVKPGSDIVSPWETLLAALPSTGATIELDDGDHTTATTWCIDGIAHNKSNLTVKLGARTRVIAGPNAHPCYYIRDTSNNVITGGVLVGNADTAGPYESIFTDGGITDGSSAGKTAAAYSAGYAGTITVNSLGVGWVIAGDVVSLPVGGGVYDKYVVQAPQQIASGVVSLTLDRPLDHAYASGVTAWIGQTPKVFYTTGGTAGVNSLNLYAADAFTDNVNPRFLAGDQFVFLNYADPDDPDYSTVYTVTGGPYPIVGAYPNCYANGVQFTPPLAKNIAPGTATSSFQDPRNNKATTLLLFNTKNCSVQSVGIDKPQSHAIAFNATVRAPWDGARPELSPNTNIKLTDCYMLSGTTGSAFSATHASGGLVAGNRSYITAPKMNGVSFEQCEDIYATNNYIRGMKYGMMSTGYCDNVVFESNVVRACNVLITLRNANIRNAVLSNILKPDPALTSYAILVVAGARDMSLIEDTSNNFALVADNMISGKCKVSGAYGGSSIMVQPQHSDANVASSLQPYYVRLKNNTIYFAAKHGIHVLTGGYIEMEDNTVFGAGYNGIRAENCTDLDLIGNTVIDSGLTSSASGIYLSGVVDAWLERNRSLARNSTQMPYGLEEGALCTGVGQGRNKFQGNTGRILSNGGLDSTFYGPGAGYNSTAQQAAGFGYEALRLATGTRNTAHGHRAGGSVTTGADNTCIGQSSGNSQLTTGSRNTLLGRNTDAQNTVNGIALGIGAVITRNGEVAIGDNTGASPVLVSQTVTTDSGDRLCVIVNGVRRKLALLND